MPSLDALAQEQVAHATANAARAVPMALGGSLIFGYTLTDVAAIIGIVVTLAQFSYWVWEKFFKKDK